MSDFKVGDRIKITRQGHNLGDPGLDMTGEVGTVTHTNASRNYPYKVNLDNYLKFGIPADALVTGDEIEAVEPLDYKKLYTELKERHDSLRQCLNTLSKE